MLNKILKIAGCSCCVFLIVLIAAKPDIYLKSAGEGIKLWALTVVPSLLPFFFLSSLSSALGFTSFLSRILQKTFSAVFRLPGVCAYAFVVSIVSGYPAGAKTVADLRENGFITDAEATRAGALCSSSGPLFVIGCVGAGAFGNSSAGYALLLSHILSAIVCGLVFRFYGEYEHSRNRLITPDKKLDNVLYECAYSSVISILVVGGFICVFYLIADAASFVGLTYPAERLSELIFRDDNIAKGIAEGIVECTRGCRRIAASGVSRNAVSAACGIISFGGISVIAQSAAFLKKAKANVAIFFLSKILQSIVGFFICYLLFPSIVG